MSDEAKEPAGSHLKIAKGLKKYQETGEVPAEPATSSPVHEHGILSSAPFDTWNVIAANQPDPKKLVGELWREGELTLFFANMKVGKTMLCVQIAQSIAHGNCYFGEAFKSEADPQPVVLLDLEVTEKQQQQRYTDKLGNTFKFGPNLHRVAFNSNPIPQGMDYEEAMFDAIRHHLEIYNAKVLIVDNLTMMANQDTDGTRDAQSLMRKLLQLKREGYSILCIEHTTKRFNQSEPLAIEALQGSKQKPNLADGIFAMNVCADNRDQRYIRQFPGRGGECVYHEDNVAVLEYRDKGNFKGFHYIEKSAEKDCLPQQNSAPDPRDLEIKAMHEAGKTDAQIAEAVGLHRSTIGRKLKQNKS